MSNYVIIFFFFFLNWLLIVELWNRKCSNLQRISKSANIKVQACKAIDSNKYTLMNQNYMLFNYFFSKWLSIRRIWRYQRGNQNQYIEEKQTTQWPKEKVQKNKQRSTKHTYKPKERVTRAQLKTGGELKCYGRVSSSCSTSDTRRVNLVTNPVIMHRITLCSALIQFEIIWPSIGCY